MESLYTSQSDNFPRQPMKFCRLSLFFGILLPYLPPPLRQPLLFFTKIYECMECFRQGSNLFLYPDYSHASGQEQISDIISKLSPFLDEQDRTKLSQMQNMMQMMSLYQTFQEMAPFMSQMGMPDGAGPFSFAGAGAQETVKANQEPDSAETSSVQSGSQGFPDTQALYSMLSPEQQELFQNLKAVMTMGKDE